METAGRRHPPRARHTTPGDKLARIPGMVREAVEAQPQTRFDRAHFKAFGDSALEFEVVYYVLDPGYNLLMDIGRQINLALFERLAREGVDFAYPTLTLYVQAQRGPLFLIDP